METTIAQLIQNALEAEKDTELYISSSASVGMNTSPSTLKKLQEAAILANNALNERLNELIEAKVNQMLKRA